MKKGKVMGLEEILSMSVENRLAAIERIWDSLDTEKIKVPQSQIEETRRRQELARSGKMEWRSYEEVIKKLRSKD